MRTVQWPDSGDGQVFRKLMMRGVTATVAVISFVTTVLSLLFPAFMTATIPFGVASIMLVSLWIHARAFEAARSAEIVRSFAGLAVLHRGTMVTIDSKPLVGTFETRFAAAAAALDRGIWAVIVCAYDRYYLLSGSHSENKKSPFAFRTAAVADVVPAVSMRRPA